MNTYALGIKKTYKDLSTSVNKDVYEIVAIFDTEEKAEEAVLEYEVYAKLALNKIDTRGIFTSFVSKVLSFEGELTKEQAQAMMDASGDMFWYAPTRRK